MRNLLLTFLLFCLCSYAFSQNYYYYYGGKKQYLEIDTTRVFISSSSNEGIVNFVKTKLRSNATPTIRKINFSNTRRTQRKTQRDFYWTTQKTNKLVSHKQAIKDFKQSPDVETVSPFFKIGNSDSFAMSNLFYVKLKNESDLNLLETFCKENEVDLIGEIEFMPLWFTIACTKETEGNALIMANKFYESGKFSQAEPDLMNYKQSATINDPFYGFQWSFDNTSSYGSNLNILKAWNYSKGKDIIVAVVDGGIQLNHPDLTLHASSYNAVTNSAPSSIYNAHGTAVAGIVGANQNNIGTVGVAPQSTLMSVSVNFDNANSISHLGSGINVAWQNGAAVINNSWGGGTPSNIITEAINNALSQGRNGLGCVVTFAVGNSDAAVNFPANLPQVIGVGAMSTDGKRKSKKSPDTEQWGSCYGEGLDVVAPGVLIPTTDQTSTDGYNPYTNIHIGAGGTLYKTDFSDYGYTQFFNGTSSACPHVSGVAALILAINPKLTQQEVRNIIESTAKKNGGYSYSTNKSNGTWNNEMGYGLVDAYEACKKAFDNREASVILGSTSVCTENIYKIENLPSGTIVSWTLENSPNRPPYPQLVLNSLNPYECTITNTYKYPLECRLVATVTLPNGKIHYPFKDIISEPAPLTTAKGTYTQVQSPTVNIVNKAFETNALFIRPNIEASIRFTNISKKRVLLSTFSGNGIPASWYYNQSNTTLYVTLPTVGSYGYVFSIGEEDSCNKLSFTIFASNTATRSVEMDSNTLGTVNIYELFSGNKVYNQKNVTIKSFDIKSTNLNEGYYIIETITESERTANKVYLTY